MLEHRVTFQTCQISILKKHPANLRQDFLCLDLHLILHFHILSILQKYLCLLQKYVRFFQEVQSISLIKLISKLRISETLHSLNCKQCERFNKITPKCASLKSCETEIALQYWIFVFYIFAIFFPWVFLVGLVLSFLLS